MFLIFCSWERSAVYLCVSQECEKLFALVQKAHKFYLIYVEICLACELVFGAYFLVMDFYVFYLLEEKQTPNVYLVLTAVLQQDYDFDDVL